jgi:uncharacterized UPF0160 family protein
MSQLITHSGSFHADDVTAFAILSSLPEFSGAELVRTRDMAVINAACAKSVVFDVGMVFNADLNKFDHHMPSPPMRETAEGELPVPYSSVGLVWAKFGRAFITAMFPDLEDAIASAVWDKMDRSVILQIDMADNGVGERPGSSSLSSMIDDFNSTWLTTQADEDFINAAEFAKGVLRRKLTQFHAAALAGPYAQSVFSATGTGQIAIFEKSAPWKSAIHKGGFDHILYVITQNENGWYVNAVPPEPGSFDQRKALPKAWAGLEGEELAKVSGVSDATFCHNKRFICAAKSLDGAKALANIALAAD